MFAEECLDLGWKDIIKVTAKLQFTFALSYENISTLHKLTANSAVIPNRIPTSVHACVFDLAKIILNSCNKIHV